jgi:NAD(P)-dependent dehydrogenase (short-subunit alcohol dehydrogenase family)
VTLPSGLAGPEGLEGLEGKVALVTDAASGIGRATALAFARVGVRVAAVDIDESGLSGTVDLAGAPAGAVLALPADVRDPDAFERAVSRTVEVFGRVDIASNSAGIQGPYVPLLDYSEDDFAAVLAVDLIGVWRCMKHEMRRMVAQGSGSIVNTSSMLAEVGLEGSCAYTAAKHGVHGLTRTAALEAAPAGVRVNAVAPGITRTRMTDAETDTLLPAVPLHRIAEPEEVAQAVLWLASPAASYVTGTVLVVDGGYLAR